MATPASLFCNNCGAANQGRAVYCRACGTSLQAIQPTLYNSATGRLLANILLKQRYRIITSTGKGGMGAVYRAEDTQLGNRQVAVKEMSQSGLSPQEQKDAADAFRQEAIILARLQHPNLPSIFDHFEENGRWYLVMSFIEGETLADYLSRAQNGRLPLDEALQVGMQLCNVLGYLHNQQPAIIFRDLKPTNVMRSPDGHIYLIDFGIARHFKPGQAKDTAYYGSMGYAPPEQYGRAQTTPRSDIYSLGATLYQLLSGHDPSSTPFRFPPLQSLVPGIPPGLETLIAQMLELDEEKRPASVLPVKQELQAHMASTGQRSQISTPSSLAPTQLAQPSSPPSVTQMANASAPTQQANISVPALPAQASAQPVSARASWKKQILATLILTLCQVVSFYVFFWIASINRDPFDLSIYLGFLPYGLLFLFPIFSALVFGPLRTVLATGVGVAFNLFLWNFAAFHWPGPSSPLLPHGFLAEVTYYFHFWSLLGIPLILVGLFTGLIFFKTKGQYNNRLMLLLVPCVIGAAVVLVINLTFISITYRDNSFSDNILYALAMATPCLILTPLLLLLRNKIMLARATRRGQSYP